MPPKKKQDGSYPANRIAKVNGRPGEWAVINRSRDQTRVARIGPDGSADSVSELVPTADVVDLKRSHLLQVDRRGGWTLPADLRRRYGITENTPLQITEEDEQFVVRPMRLVPASTPQPANLDELLSHVTPENLHEEIDFGPPVGEEIW
jgi:antitoxin MazE